MVASTVDDDDPFGVMTDRRAGFQTGHRRRALVSLPSPSNGGVRRAYPSRAPTWAGHVSNLRPWAVRGCHLDKRKWNTVIIDGSLSDHAISDMIEDFYDLVVSKLPQARRSALGWRGDPRST